jgi:hypothetical protein
MQELLSMECAAYGGAVADATRRWLAPLSTCTPFAMFSSNELNVLFRLFLRLMSKEEGERCARF